MGFDATIVCECVFLYAKNKGLTKICVFGLVALRVQLWLVYLCKALLFTILSVFMFRHVCVYLCWITLKSFYARLSC